AEEGDAADNEAYDEGDDNTWWGHSTSPQGVSGQHWLLKHPARIGTASNMTRPFGVTWVSSFWPSQSSSYRIISVKASKPANQQGNFTIWLSDCPGGSLSDPL